MFLTRIRLLLAQPDTQPSGRGVGRNPAKNTGVLCFRTFGSRSLYGAKCPIDYSHIHLLGIDFVVQHIRHGPFLNCGVLPESDWESKVDGKCFPHLYAMTTGFTFADGTKLTLLVLQKILDRLPFSPRYAFFGSGLFR